MRNNIIAAILVLVFVFAGLLAIPVPTGRSVAAAPAFGPTSPSMHAATTTEATATLAPAAPAPLTTYPRTVLIETFTGVWCIHCPAESQALYALDQNTSTNVLDISELHVCASSSDCAENYVPPDGTSTARGTFYGVQGFPDVFFDGTHSVYGATNSESQMLSWYEQNISLAASYAGNVSIQQTATVTSSTVTGHANITSGITGTYNAVSYLLQYIDKTNVNTGEGPHDIGNVVRETLYNHPVTLTAGETTEINSTGTVLSSWNQQNLSVVTFVQQNSTKIIENANQVPVSTLQTTVTTGLSTLGSGGNTTVAVHVTNLTGGAPVSGANVTLTSSSGGFFSPATGVTAANGTFESQFTAPTVTSTVADVVSAEAIATGEIGFGASTITVVPYVPPTQPTGLTVTPGVAGVTLNWTAPSTGGGGITYVVYDATSATGTYTEVNVTTETQYVVTGLTAGHAYWYKVEAMDLGGYSPETSAIAATGTTGESHGLPSSAGWWLSIDSMNFTSPTSAALVLYLPNGVYSYTYGTTYYARVASVAAPPPLTVDGAPANFTVTFGLSLATLKGTVTPANTTLTLNGTDVPIVNGAFDEPVVAGTYSLEATNAGYTSNTTNVTLDPGNATTVNVTLLPIPAGSGNVGTSSSGLSTTATLELVGAGAVAVVVVVAAIVMLSRKGKGGGASGMGPK